MNNEMIVCVPGIWKDSKDFLTAVVTSTRGEFIFAAGILMNPKGEDHVELDFGDPYDEMAEAFRIAGQGRLSNETLNKIVDHRSVVYLHFPLDILSQRARIAKFTEVISRCGGIAVKLENSGIAHEWERWFSLLRSDNSFDAYCASVVLISDASHYYSCGMRSFGLPDAQISHDFDVEEAAELLNKFNYYRIVEEPNLGTGHTFSLTIDGPHFRIELLSDKRYPDDDLFHNQYGIWDLTRV